MPLGLDAVVTQAPDCLTADVNDEAVVMAVEHGNYVALDPVGKEIWRRIATPCVVEELCEALAAEYDAAAPTIEKDVLEFLDQLLEAGAVTVRG